MIAKRITPANPMDGEGTRSFVRLASGGQPRARLWPLLAAVLCLAAFAPRVAAQSARLAEDPPRPDDPSAPAAAPASAPGNSGASPSGASSGNSLPGKPVDTLAEPPKPESAATPAPPAQPEFDPLHAEKSLEVGNFYLKKGDLDAAIDRFQEAARLNPKMAKPYLYLGEIYEKRSDAPDAVTAYRKYLQLFQNAPDRDKVQRRIEKLEGKTGHEGAPAGSG